MSYTITINFPKMPAKHGEIGSEEFWQLILTFTVDAAGTNETHWSYDKNLALTKIGQASWEYDLEDADLVVGSLDVTIEDIPTFDEDGYLLSLLEDSDVLKEFAVEVQVDGVADFTGKVTERNIKYVRKLSEGGGELHCRAYPSTNLLDASAVIDDRGTPTNNLGYLNETSGNTISNVVNNEDGTLTITHNNANNIDDGDLVRLRNIGGITDIIGWHYAEKVDSNNFKINFSTTQDSWSTTGFDSVSIFDGADVIALTAILGDIFQIVDSGISYASGDISLKHNWLFSDDSVTEYDFDELEAFTENFVVGDTLNQTPLPGVNSTKNLLKILAKNFAAFAGVLNNNRAFFHKLFYYDPNDLQTLGVVLEHDFNYEFGLVDYVSANVSQTEEVFYDAGSFTHNSNRKLTIEDLPLYWYTAFSSSASNIRVIADSDAILYGKDTDVDTAWKDIGEMIADFFFKFRGDIANARVDRFKVVGIGYDYTKSFNHFGNKYQIITLKKDYANGTSEIKALNLGAV